MDELAQHEQVTENLSDIQHGRSKEQTELERRLEEVKSAYTAYRLKWWEAKRWDVYLHKTRELDYWQLPELNGYLSKWYDDENFDVPTVFEKCHDCLKILDDLNLAVLVGRLSSEKELSLWKEGIQNVQICIAEKLDYVSFMLLKNTDKYLDPETYNMHYLKRFSANGESVMTLCLWANINRAMRRHGMSVLGFSFWLPLDIIEKDCAVRLLHTLFDHLSPAQDEVPAISGHAKDKADIPVLKSSEGKLKEKTSLELSEMEAVDHEVKSQDILVEKEVLESDEFEQDEEDDSEGFEEQKSEEAMVHDPSEIPLVEPEVHVVDLDEYFVVGGIYHFDLLALPDKTATSGGFTFITRQKPRLRKIQYKRKIVPPRSIDGDTAFNFSVREKNRFKRELSSAILLQVRLPRSVVFMEDPIPARWHPEKVGYSRCCIFEPKYSEDKRIVSFKTNQFGAFGMLQRRYQNLPYERWAFTGGDPATLHLCGRHIDIEIEVSIDGFKIASLQSQLNSAPGELEGKWIFAEEVVRKLASMGINLETRENAGEFVNIHTQNRAVEDSVYDSIALLCGICSFGSFEEDTTKPDEMSMMWNISDEEGINRVVVSGDQVLDFEVYLENNRRGSENGAGTEGNVGDPEPEAGNDERDTGNGEQAPEDPDEKVGAYGNLYGYICSRLDEERMEASNLSNVCFVENVRSLLKICRPLSATSHKDTAE